MVSIYRNTIFLLCNISMLFFPFFHLFIRRNCFFMPAHMTGCRRHACHQEKIQNFHDCRSRNTGKPELLGKELFPGGRDDAVVCHLCQRRLRIVGDQNDRSTISFAPCARICRRLEVPELEMISTTSSGPRLNA